MNNDYREARFPIRLPLEPDESGQGYLLRLGALNGFEKARQALTGKGWGSMPTELDAELVSRWFGESVPKLRWALGAANSSTAKGRTFYGGHQLSRPSFINRTQPRVCTACLEKDEYCKFSWDFSLVTACHQHQVALIDRCNACHTALRWRRPTPSVCTCWSPLPLSTPTYQPQTVEFEFERWVQLQIRLKSLDPTLCAEALSMHKTTHPSSALMKMIWPMSLDAGLLITYALSTAAGSPFVAPAASPSSRPSLERAQDALNAANQLATQLHEEQAARMYIGSSKKAFELIASCLTHDFSAADRGFAQSLLAMLIKQYKTQRWSSAKPQLSQLDLF
jgi:TniQ